MGGIITCCKFKKCVPKIKMMVTLKYSIPFLQQCRGKEKKKTEKFRTDLRLMIGM